MEFVVLKMRYKNYSETVYFYVANIGRSDVIIGHNWLEKHNPEINWKTGEITFNQCLSSCERGRIDKLKTEAKMRKQVKRDRKPMAKEEVVDKKNMKETKFR